MYWLYLQGCEPFSLGLWCHDRSVFQQSWLMWGKKWSGQSSPVQPLRRPAFMGSNYNKNLLLYTLKEELCSRTHLIELGVPTATLVVLLYAFDLISIDEGCELLTCLSWRIYNLYMLHYINSVFVLCVQWTCSLWSVKFTAIMGQLWTHHALHVLEHINGPPPQGGRACNLHIYMQRGGGGGGE